VLPSVFDLHWKNEQHVNAVQLLNKGETVKLWDGFQHQETAKTAFFCCWEFLGKVGL
jgi:hypothetical protein